MEINVHDIISKEVKVPKSLIVSVIVFNLLYLSWWLTFRNVGNIYLYLLLLVGEMFHVWQAIGFALTVKDQSSPSKEFFDEKYKPPVDVFITVCGEPLSIVEKTVQSAIKMDYPNFKVFLLNDGYVAKKNNWKAIEGLKKKYKINVITRKKPGGAKAGNINNALKSTKSKLFVVFDADHVPHRDFLKQTIPYFNDQSLAILQTPQYYLNRKDSYLSGAAWEQQELFFGPICRGKSNGNAMFWCGTNAVIRRKALEEVGGVPEDNIAEDFLASLKIHEAGWKSMYLPKILAYGLGPFNLKDYITQQYRWARGSLEIIFRHNPLFNKKLTWIQKMHYMHSSSYYLNGIVVIIDALIPIVVLMTGWVPVINNSGDFLLFFFPFMISTMYMLMFATSHTVTFKSLQLSVSLFYVHTKAIIAVIFNKKSTFNVTPKNEEQGNFILFATPHIIYLVIAILTIIYSITKFGITPNLMNNSMWILFNCILFFGFIRPAYKWKNLLSTSFDNLSKIITNLNKVLSVRLLSINNSNRER